MTADSVTTDVAGPTTRSPGPTVKDRAQFGLCAVLGLLGLVVIWDALRMTTATSSNDPVGPRLVPLIVGGALLITAMVYVVEVARGGIGEAEGGEDVDTSGSTDWRTVTVIAGAFLLNAVLLEHLGWVISGALLFGLTAWGLGSRHPVRAFALGLSLSLATFYIFAIGLGVNLPVGLLQGIL